ncbi:MAG: hypothetical protein KAY26_00335 [Acinetobacter sp.]|nr:hypothetical protein [Acinetobacter sp.]
MSHLAIILVLLVAVVVIIAMLYFSFKLLRQTQQQEKSERQPKAEYRLHPQLQKELKQRENEAKVDSNKDASNK